MQAGPRHAGLERRRPQPPRQCRLRTIREFEAGGRPILDTTRNRLRAVFTVSGIEFLNDADGIGIRRRLSVTEYCQRHPAEQRL